MNREGWKAKPGISKLCEVGGDIILRSRNVGLLLVLTSNTMYTVLYSHSKFLV